MDDSLKTDSITISAAMLKSIAELDEFKGAWVALGQLAPERLSRLRRVATIASIGSSTRIEGARLSDRDVDRLLSNIEITAFSSRDEEEVASYAAAIAIVNESYSAIDLSENHIQQLHRDLLQYVAKDERHRGKYKTLDNHVEAFGPDGENLGVVFKTTTPFETPTRMKELVTWTRAALARGDLHPLLVIGVFIVVLLAIHPFQDGNGRLARVLTTLLLLRAGYNYVPYASLESAIEQTKENYYRTLRQTQNTLDSENPDWQPWLTYFLDALCSQKRGLERKLQWEGALQSLPALSVRILEIARSHGRVTVAEAARITETNRNTVKDHLRSLYEDRHLQRHGAGRGTWYSLV